jgi:hypothetical protein
MFDHIYHEYFRNFYLQQIIYEIILRLMLAFKLLTRGVIELDLDR